jgi:hypothetical protein
VVIGGGMVIGSRIALSGVIRDTNLFKITIDLNIITISITCGVIANMETLSGYAYSKKRMCQLIVAIEVIRMKVQSTLVNLSPQIKLIIAKGAVSY